MIFVYQTLMASQMAVGANTVRPFRLQSHLRYSHNVRRNNSQHCLLLFIREKSKLSRFDIGLSRAPAPTPKFYRRKIAPLFADFTLCRRIEKRCRLTLRYNHVSGNNIAILLFPSAPLSRLAPIEALPQAPTGLCPVPTMGFTPCPWTFCSLRSVFPLLCAGLSSIHRSYLRQSLRQSIIKLIKAFQSPLPVRSHC